MGEKLRWPWRFHNTATIDLILNLVRRDLKLKYRGSYIGLLWSMANPLLTLVIYTFVFKVIMHNTTPHYSMFMISGIIPWNFFAGTLTGSVAVIFENADLIKKVSNDRIIFVLSSVCFQGFIYLMNLLVIIVAMPIAHLPFTWSILFIIPGSIMVFLFVLGLVLIACTVNVYFMDTRHLLDIVVMFWFWLTPIVYASSLIPSRYTWLMNLNPMSSILQLYRSAVLGYPLTSAIGVTLVEIAVLLVVGLWLFYTNQKKFAEVV